MSQLESYAPGQFSWVDLLTPDAAASKRFYEPLFGWSHLEEQDPAGNTYTQFTALGLRVAGMGEMSDELKRTGMPPVWNSYVTVDDADATVARCQELGGGVELPVTPIGAAGRMAILSDPAGARISLWQPGEHRGAEVVNDPGAFCWNELLSRDVEASKRFYADLFGWDYRLGEGGGGYCEILNAGRTNGGILPWEKEMGEVPPNWSVYFSVADCDETLKRIQELGGQLLAGPVDIPPGRFAVTADAAGGVFNVIYMHAPE